MKPVTLLTWETDSGLWNGYLKLSSERECFTCYVYSTPSESDCFWALAEVLYRQGAERLQDGNQ